jgi:hypothetical protein
MKLKKKMEWMIGKEINALLMGGLTMDRIEQETEYTAKEAKYFVFAFNTINRVKEFEMYGSLPPQHSYLKPEDFDLTNDDIINYLKRTKQYPGYEEESNNQSYENIGIMFGNWVELTDEDDE